MAENRELALVLKLVADEFQKELKNSQSALGQFNTFIKDWRTQMAAAGTALFAIAKSTADYGDQLFKTSQKVGIQVEALAGLQHAAKLADVDNRQLQIGLQALSRAMVDSAQGTGEGKEAFDRVGVSATDAQGKLRPMHDVLLELADVFSRSEDGAGKTEVAMKLMGKSGADLIPLLNAGKISIQEMEAEAKRLGLTMSEQDAKAAEAFNDAITAMEAQARGFSNTIGVHMLGPLTELLGLMNELGSGPIMESLKFFLKTINIQIVMFGTLLKETAASVDWLRGKMNFDELAEKIKRIETEGWNKILLLEHPAVRDLLNPKQKKDGRDAHLGVIKPGGKASGGNAETDAAKEQERLGKALLDIYLSQNNALEIRNKLQGGQGQLSEYFLAFDRQEQFRKEDEAAEVRKGQLIVDQTKFQVQLRDAALAQERQGLVDNLQAWIAYDEQVGASTELRIQHQTDLVKANLAKQLELTQEQAGQLIQAWQAIDSNAQEEILSQTKLNAQERVTVELQTLTELAAINQRYSGDILSGWQIGLQRYVQATQSAFGFAADMARRTAQFMEQNFRTFFFDLMDERITSLKDVWSSFANFVKQIMSQVFAQLATMMALKGLTGGFGSLGGFGGGLSDLFGGGGFGAAQTPLFGFARGGMVLGTGNRDTVPALLTPGEGVLNRRAMATLDRLNNGGVPGGGPVNIQVNLQNFGATTAPQVNYRRHMRGVIIDIINSDSDLRQMFMGHRY